MKGGFTMAENERDWGHFLKGFVIAFLELWAVSYLLQNPGKN